MDVDEKESGLNECDDVFDSSTVAEPSPDEEINDGTAASAIDSVNSVLECDVKLGLNVDVKSNHSTNVKHDVDLIKETSIESNLNIINEQGCESPVDSSEEDVMVNIGRIEDQVNKFKGTIKKDSLSYDPLIGKDNESLRSFPDSEEGQLIDNVQILYPEIEFSKTNSDIIQEGKAFIIKESQNVFYNPVQEFNRDISVLVISVFSEEHKNDPRCRSRGTKRKVNETYDDDSKNNITDKLIPGFKYDDGIVILEALSATGLRSIRYAKEVPGVKEIVANDISVNAVNSIKKNVEYNSVTDLITTSHNDASLFMYMRKAQGNYFDVVDLDPYGCPSRFLDAAVQCVRDGGLLLVTCTDMAVLAGNSPETCYVKYGAISLRNPACHEMALRIALQCIESHANRYGRYIIPQLSFSADFYIRVIVKVYTSPAMCKKTTSKLSMVYQCVGCQMLSYWPLGLVENVNNSVKHHLPRGPPVNDKCPHCASHCYQGGPIWSGPLHSNLFIDKMLQQLEDREFVTSKRMEGMLELIKEELSSTLLYYVIDSLCSKVHCEVIPRNKFVSAILNAGYKVTLSHAAPNSVKTNAPAGFIWDIIRCWVQQHPVNPKRLHTGSVAEKILAATPRSSANFDLHPEVLPKNHKKLLRYQQNPQPFWGPGTRDKNNCSVQNKMTKSYANQNKKYRKTKVDGNRAQVTAAIRSKTIDIIEVVTITDDDDEEDSMMKDGVLSIGNDEKNKIEKVDSLGEQKEVRNNETEIGLIDKVISQEEIYNSCKEILKGTEMVSSTCEKDKVTISNDSSSLIKTDEQNDLVDCVSSENDFVSKENSLEANFQKVIKENDCGSQLEGLNLVSSTCEENSASSDKI